MAMPVKESVCRDVAMALALAAALAQLESLICAWANLRRRLMPTSGATGLARQAVATVARSESERAKGEQNSKLPYCRMCCRTLAKRPATQGQPLIRRQWLSRVRMLRRLSACHWRAVFEPSGDHQLLVPAHDLGVVRILKQGGCGAEAF